MLLALVAAALEIGLRLVLGFGAPILYDNPYACGYRPLPNQRVNRTAGREVRINNLGMRARRDWPAARPPGERGILYLGDSVTHGGSFVDDADTFAERGGASLAGRSGRAVRVGNAAVNG